jgi:hypothetical protein
VIYDGWKESRMQWQREDWKDSEKNGDWESKDVSDIQKSIQIIFPVDNFLKKTVVYI